MNSTQQRKQMLVAQINQQRIDLSNTSQQWLELTEPVDKLWRRMYGLKNLALTGFVVIALIGWRRPVHLFRLSRRVFGLWGTARLIQRTFDNR